MTPPGDPSEGGIGWYQDILSLEEPVVPDKPDEEWYNMPVVECVLESMKDPNATTILLNWSIKQILGKD